MLTIQEVMKQLERVYGKMFRNPTAAANIVQAQARKFYADNEEFAMFVGQKLANYMDGSAGHRPHDVLFEIQQKWKEHYGFLPRPEWEDEEEEEEEYYQANCGSWDCRAPECGRKE